MFFTISPLYLLKALPIPLNITSIVKHIAASTSQLDENTVFFPPCSNFMLPDFVQTAGVGLTVLFYIWAYH